MKRWRNNRQSLLDGYDISEIADCNPLADITLKECRLNSNNNFMQAPVCECGCGGKANIVLHNEDEVLDFCEMMCWENDCEFCGVFAITGNNKILFAIKCDGEVNLFIKKYDNNPEAIGKVFDEIDLHCYGLIVYNGNDSYRIVES